MSFALADSAGGRFAISGGKLVVAGSIDYEAARTHTVMVRATDSGGLTLDKLFTITVSNVNELVAIDVQRGAVQRSYVRYVDLIFESSSGLSQLINEGRVALTRSTLDGLSPVAVNLSGKMSVSGNKILIDFGSNGLGGNRNSIAGNGYYNLSVDADRNGTKESLRHFYRLLGDTNGDRVVDAIDLANVTRAQGKRGTKLAADVNGDSVVNSQDLSIARAQQGKRLAGGLVVDD